MNNTIKNIEGAIFDLDGTILDSMFIWNEVGLKFLEIKGITPPPGAEDEFTTMSIVQAAEYYIKNFDPNETVEGIVECVNGLVHDFYYSEVLKKEGIEEFLEFLKNRNVKMCVATATDKYLVEKALERNGLLHYFSEIFTCTSVGAGKDTPVIYDKSLEHLGTAKENTYVFEDAFYAIKTARNAGYKIVGIKDVSEKEEREVIESYCDYFIENYSEIYKFFEV